MQIEVTIQDEQIKELFTRLSSQAKDCRTALAEIGEIVRSSIQRNFHEGGRPPWKVSARARTQGGITLSDTGRLRNSITYRVAQDHVAIGTNVAYAAIHQFGGRTRAREIRPKKQKALMWPGAKKPVKKVDHPGSDIPARPYLLVQDADWSEISNALERHLLKGP